MFRQIVEKKFPFWDTPKSGHLVIIEANHESGNDIELLTEVRERTESFDSLNNSVNTEQARDFPKHWQAIHVQTNSGMTEELRDVEEVSCAATQNENLPGTSDVELKLANPFDVHSDPTIEIEIFRPVRTGIRYGVSLANLLESIWIDRLNNALCLQLEPVRAQHSKGVFSRARQAPAIDQFSYFMAKLHRLHLVAKRNNFN